MSVQKGYAVAHLRGRRQYNILQSTGKPGRVMVCPLKEQKINSMPTRLQGRGSLLFIAEGIGE